MLANILDKDEREIYNLVKKYTYKKPFISINEILPFLRQRLRKNPNFTSYKIEMILKNLIKKNLILPRTKLVKEQVLTLPKREKIYDYILTNPGININQLINQLEIGSNEILWHLNILGKYQFVRSTTVQNQKIFFNFNMDSKYDEIFYYLKNVKAQKIISLLDESNKALGFTEISKRTKIHYNTAKKYIEILKIMKLIRTSYKNKKKEFSLERNNYYDIVKLIDIKKKEKL